MIYLDLTTIDQLGDAAIERITLDSLVPTVAVLTERKIIEEDRADHSAHRRAWEDNWS